MDRISILDYFKKDGDAKHLVASPPVITDRKYITLDMLDHVMDDHIDNGAMEFSITFQPRYRNTYRNKDIAKILDKYLKRELQEEVYYILYPELGDNLNLHYHGIIYTDKKRMKTYFSNLQKYLNRDIGRTYIRQIQYVESYKKYIKKKE